MTQEERDQLLKEIREMGNRLNNIEQLLSNETIENKNQTEQANVYMQQSNVNTAWQGVPIQPMAQPPVNPYHTIYNNPPYAQPVTIHSAMQSKPIETIIGKYALPVIATILIMVGVGVFAALIWDVLPGILKFIAVFMLGIAIGVAGDVIRKLKNFDIFGQALIAISLSVVYLDFIIGNTTFDVYNSVIAIILILIWCASCIVIAAKTQKKLFSYILFIGVAISAIVSGGLAGVNNIIVLLILNIIIEIIAFVTYYRQYKEGSIASAISTLVALISYIVCIYNTFKLNIDVTLAYRLCKNTAYLIWLAWAMSSIIALKFVLYNRKEHKIDFIYILNESCTFMYIVSIITAVGAANIFGHSVLAITAVALVVFTLCKESHVARYGGIVAVIGFIACGEGLPISIVLCMSLLYLAYGMIDDSIEMILESLSLVFIIACSAGNAVDEMAFAAIAAIGITVIIGIISWKKGKKYLFNTVAIALVIEIMVNELLQYLQLAFFNSLYASESWLLECTMILLVTVILSLLVIKRIKWPGVDITFTILSLIVYFNLLIVHWEDTTSKSELANGILNFTHFALLVGYQLIIAYVTDIVHKKRVITDLIFALTFTSTFIWVMGAAPFIPSGIITSIMVMLSILTLIACGFRFNHKTFRVYGLIVLLITVFKMLFIDISFENSIVTVLMLIVAGLICLVISAIYFKLEKSISQEK